MKLFMFMVGGDCGNSNIELHDIRFSIGLRAEDCRDDLRKQWWGEPTSLHLDCWGAVEQADGFDIVLTSETQASSGAATDKLFFVNLGGYDPEEFTELHKNILIVAPDARAATRKALSRIRSWKLPHKDNVFEVDKAIDVSAMMERYGYGLKLIPAEDERPFEFECAYIPIGKV